MNNEVLEINCWSIAMPNIIIKINKLYMAYIKQIR